MLGLYPGRDGQVALRDQAQDGTGEFRYVWGRVAGSRRGRTVALAYGRSWYMRRLSCRDKERSR
jgi:hypothetical protein